jgi:SAM-dependent methyltransferase
MDLERLQAISTGFIKAKVVLAAAELKLFDITAGEGVTAAEVAAKIGGDLHGTEILLDALVAVEMLEKRDGLYRLRSDLVPILREDSPSQFVSMLRHRNRMFREWSRIEDRVRGRAPVPASDRELLHDADANRNFIRAMVAASGELAPGVVDRIDLAGVRRVADLGGGPGHYAAEFASRDPGIEAWLVDLPRTLETARGIAAEWLSHERVRTLAWDFYEDPPPADLPSFDLVFLSQVVHAESPERNRALFGRIGRLLEPGGRLVVHEFFVDPGRTTPVEAALFAVNMLAMTPGGRTYTVDEVGAWARDAGLTPVGHERISERSALAFFRR